MKSFIVLAGLIFAASAQASIVGSNLETDHQTLIIQSIEKTCALEVFSIEQTRLKVTEDRVDQGIVDLRFETGFKVLDRIDAGVFNTYQVKVESVLWDQYDHARQVWGAYSIESVECRMVTK